MADLISAIALVQDQRQLVRTLRYGDEANHIAPTLIENIDYGIIPGTGNKPTLLLPGIEKITRALEARPVFKEIYAIRDFELGLVHYEFECTLVDNMTGLPIIGGVGIGSCNSRESSFRWRQGTRKCPKCGQAAIRRGAERWGGGWYCNEKAGGCSSKFSIDDPDIETQAVGKIENPDIYDQFNAVIKRSKKRAWGDAIKGAACVSDYFTVDVEDFMDREDRPDSPQQTQGNDQINDAPAKPKGGREPDLSKNGGVMKAVIDELRKYYKNPRLTGPQILDKVGLTSFAGLTRTKLLELLKAADTVDTTATETTELQGNAASDSNEESDAINNGF